MYTAVYELNTAVCTARTRQCTGRAHGCEHGCVRLCLRLVYTAVYCVQDHDYGLNRVHVLHDPNTVVYMAR